MDIRIRKIQESDRLAVTDMMREFYRSPAVLTCGSEEIFGRNVAECLSGRGVLVGYVFEASGAVIGYAMTAKSYSTEFGKNCLWIEDIYIKREFRGAGVGKAFFALIERENADCIFRLEAEAENRPAVDFYRKRGFAPLPYLELIKT